MFTSADCASVQGISPLPLKLVDTPVEEMGEGGGEICSCREQVSNGCYVLGKGRSGEGALAACRMDTQPRFGTWGRLPGGGDNKVETEYA